MKKNFIIRSFVAIFATSILFACTQDGIDNLSVQTEEKNEAMNELPKRRTYEEALAMDISHLRYSIRHKDINTTGYQVVRM